MASYGKLIFLSKSLYFSLPIGFVIYFLKIYGASSSNVLGFVTLCCRYYVHKNDSLLLVIHMNFTLADPFSNETL